MPEIATQPPRTSFVGRSRELARLASLFDEGERLVTLTGPGGAGKTRLARRFLADREHAWFCDLAGCRSPEDVRAVVAATFDVPLGESGAPGDRLLRALERRGGGLVVLDNFEQVLDAAGLVGGWIDRAPALQWLATSRTPLDLEAERVVEIAPLADEEALELFEARARAVRDGWRPAEAERGILLELCRRLDGLPLAIELAAARMEVLEASEILGRLSSRFELLRSMRRHDVPRHATLRGAIDWSWDLLAPDERLSLARLSVFEGTFSLDAAEAVLADDAGAPLDLLHALRRRSLLATTGGDAAPMRFRLLESVREFAGSRLDELGLRAACESRHEGYFEHRTLAGTVSPHELDDALAVQRRLATSDPRRAARLALALHERLAAGGRRERRLELARSAAACARAVGDDPLLAAALHVELREDVLRAGRTDVRATLAEAVELATRAGERRLLARLWQLESELDARAGRAREAVSGLERAVETCRELGDHEGEALAWRALATRTFEAGALDVSRTQLERTRELARVHGLVELEARVLSNLGVLETIRGAKALAREHALDAERLHASIGQRQGVADAAKLLGTLALDDGELEAARRSLARALALYRDTGDAVNEAVTLRWLGDVELAAGAARDARERYRQARRLHEELDEPRMEGFLRLQLAWSACDEARLGEAEEELAHAQRLFERVGDRGGAATALCYLARVRAAQRAPEAVGLATRAHDALEAAGLRHLTALAKAVEGLALLSQEAEPSPATLAKARACLGPGERVDSYLVRVGREVLERALRGTSPAPASEPEPPHLCLAADGRAFALFGRDPVDLTRRRSLRLLLEHLARVHAATPGRALNLDELFEAGWPGERAHPEAAARRVYVAIGTLRSMGLKDLLVTRDDGYLLEPGTRLGAL